LSQPHLPDDRSEAVFDDYKAPYDAQQAAVEANRCLFCYDAPCIQACPTGIDIPQFIRKIATNNVKGSARTIFDSNILGMSCARVCPVEVLCVGSCVYNEMGVPPIQIGRLQRYSTDAAFDAGWRFFEAGEDTGFSVGLVGGGPASLACAHELRRLGHAVTIYERNGVLGGLNTTGVAPYKMRADKAIEEAAWVLGIGGIEIQSAVSIPHDVSWAALNRRHQALFLGFGLGPDRLLEVTGHDLVGVEGAVAFIERMKSSPLDLSGVRKAVVVGGGNTAVDAVRELLGLGIAEVTMVYRGDEAAMSGYEHEWEVAKKDGARAIWRALPAEYLGDDQVRGIRLAHLGADKRPNGQESTIDADLVLVAIGQGRLTELVKGLDDVTIVDGKISVDGLGATSRPGVFAGGDCANGGKEVVNAAAEGKTAAQGIHAWLMSGGRRAG
jgi:dihydropyrimidine dehydrogenase (NAD+) subunit PreT